MTDEERKALWIRFANAAIVGVLSAPEGTLGDKPVASEEAARVADQLLDEYVARFDRPAVPVSKPKAAAPSACSADAEQRPGSVSAGRASGAPGSGSRALPKTG